MIDLNKVLEKARIMDEESLSILVKEYHSKIFCFFFYRVQTKEDAEDLTNEVFIRMVKSIKNQKSDFLAWIFKIARNLLTDYYRKKGRLNEISLEELENCIIINKAKGIFPEDLKKVLTFLTDEQKEVVTLKFIKGHSNNEIAKIMDKNIGAIKSLQFRAMEALRNVFKKIG